MKEETEDRIPVGRPPIPIYSLRDVDQLGTLARDLATGQTAAFYAGFFGLLQGIIARAGPEAVSPGTTLTPGRAPGRNSAGAAAAHAIPFDRHRATARGFPYARGSCSPIYLRLRALQIIAPLRESLYARADPRAAEETCGGLESRIYPSAPALLTAGFLWMHDLA